MDPSGSLLQHKMLQQVHPLFQELYFVVLVIYTLMKQFYQRQSLLKARSAGIKAILKANTVLSWSTVGKKAIVLLNIGKHSSGFVLMTLIKKEIEEGLAHICYS